MVILCPSEVFLLYSTGRSLPLPHCQPERVGFKATVRVGGTNLNVLTMPPLSLSRRCLSLPLLYDELGFIEAVLCGSDGGEVSPALTRVSRRLSLLIALSPRQWLERGNRQFAPLVMAGVIPSWPFLLKVDRSKQQVGCAVFVRCSVGAEILA